MRSSLNFLLISIVIVFGLVRVCHGGDLRKGFYKKSCPLTEDIVKNITWKHVASNSTLPAKFLRMHFHDCFVRGCDGSVLSDSTASNTAEKDAIPNQSLAGFDVIEEVKTQLEKTCPGVVSCADIVTLAARDSVSFQTGDDCSSINQCGKCLLVEETARSHALQRLSPTSLRRSSTSLPLNNLLLTKRLTVHDLVVLSGAHTTGVGHCNFFSNRLYNFTGKGDADPSLNTTYAAFLKTKCQSLSDNTTTVEMDPGSSLSFDNNYFTILKQQQGLFQSDAALLTDDGSSKIVNEMPASANFFTELQSINEEDGNHRSAYWKFRRDKEEV